MWDEAEYVSYNRHLWLLLTLLCHWKPIMHTGTLEPLDGRYNVQIKVPK